MALIKKFLGGTSTAVFCYGAFVIISLCVHSLPSLMQMLQAHGFEHSILTFLNYGFVLPMETICWIWTLMVPLYIGVDRAASFAFISKEGRNDITIGNPEHLMQAIVLSGFLYSFAVALSLVFDRDYQLMALFSSFGFSMLAYVVGRKSTVLAEAIQPEDDLNQDGIRDSEQLNETQVKTMETITAMLLDKKPLILEVNEFGEITRIEKDAADDKNMEK